VDLARRGLTQAVGAAKGAAGKLAQQAMSSAVRGAVSQVTGTSRAKTPAASKRAR
jgi:hypothetical protein